MDFNALIEDLRTAAENLQKNSTNRKSLSTVYCLRVCKAVDKVSVWNSEYDNIVTGLWVITAHFTDTVDLLVQVPNFKEASSRLFRECAKAVLNIQWQNLEEDSDVRQRFVISLANLNAKLVPLNYTRFRLLETLLENPWTDPTLAKIMGGEAEDEEEKEEVQNYISGEDAIILQLRVDMMLKENCEEYALNLCNSCLLHPELKRDLVLRKTQLSLLHKLGHRDKLQEECQNLSVQEAVNIIRQLQNRNTKEICTVLAQTFMVQHWIRQKDHKANKDLLRLWIRQQALADKDRDRFKESVWAIAKLSQSTDQIVFFIDILREQCGQSYLQLYVDMCIFAINVDKGQMETSLREGKADMVKARKEDMAAICGKLACLSHHASIKVARICVLTAFVLKPSAETLQCILKFYNTDYICCGTCNKKTDSDQGKINPATLYEVERLLNMLRPEYLNPDNSLSSIKLLCERFCKENDLNISLNTSMTKPENSNLRMVQIEAFGKPKATSMKPSNVFESVSPTNTQALLRNKLHGMQNLQPKNPPNSQNFQVSIAQHSRPNILHSGPHPSSAAVTIHMKGSASSLEPFKTRPLSSKINPSQQHLYSKSNTPVKNMYSQPGNSDSSSSLQKERQIVIQSKNPTKLNPQLIQYIQSAVRQNSSALQELIRHPDKEIVRTVMNMLNETGKQNNPPAKLLLQNPAPCFSVDQIRLPTVSTLLKPFTAVDPQSQQAALHPSSSHIYSSSASSPSTAVIYQQSTKPSSHHIICHSRQPPSQTSSITDIHKAESFRQAKVQAGYIRSAMQSSMSTLSQQKQHILSKQMSGSTITLNQTPSNFPVYEQRAAVSKDRSLLRAANLQNNTVTKHKEIRPTIISSNQNVQINPPLNRTQQSHQLTNIVSNSTFSNQNTLSHPYLNNMQQQINAQSTLKQQSTLSSDELSGSIMGIDDTIITELLQDSGIFSNTFPDIEVDFNIDDLDKKRDGRSVTVSSDPQHVSQPNYRTGHSLLQQQSSISSSFNTSNLTQNQASAFNIKNNGSSCGVGQRFEKSNSSPISSVTISTAPKANLLANIITDQQQFPKDQKAAFVSTQQSKHLIQPQQHMSVEQIREVMKQEQIEGEVTLDSSNNATYRCIICSLAFKVLEELREHVRNVCKPGLQSSSVYNTKIKQDRANSAKAGLETTTVFQCLRCFELCISNEGIKKHRLTCKRVPTVPPDIKNATLNKTSKTPPMSRSNTPKMPTPSTPQPSAKSVVADNSSKIPEMPLPFPYPSLNTKEVLDSLQPAPGNNKTQQNISTVKNIVTPSQALNVTANVTCKTETESKTVTLDTAKKEAKKEEEVQNSNVKPEKIVPPLTPSNYSEISGSGGSKFYRCKNCSQTLCSYESLLLHWKECSIKPQVFPYSNQFPLDPDDELEPGEIRPLVGKVLKNVVDIIAAVARGEIGATPNLDSDDEDIDFVISLENPCEPKPPIIPRGKISKKEMSLTHSFLSYEHSSSSYVPNSFGQGATNRKISCLSMKKDSNEKEIKEDSEVRTSSIAVYKHNSVLKMEDEESMDSIKEDKTQSNTSDSEINSEEITSEALSKLRDRTRLKPIQSFVNESFISPYAKTGVRKEKKGMQEDVSESEKGDFKCIVCGKICNSKRILIQHYAGKHLQPYTVKTVADGSSYFCHLCQKSFSTFMHYMYHVPNHGNIIIKKMTTQFSSLSQKKQNWSTRIATSRGFMIASGVKPGGISPKRAKALMSKRKAAKSARERMKKVLTDMALKKSSSSLPLNRELRSKIIKKRKEARQKGRPRIAQQSLQEKLLKKKMGSKTLECFKGSVVSLSENEDSCPSSSPYISDISDDEYVASEDVDSDSTINEPPRTRNRSRSTRSNDDMKSSRGSVKHGSSLTIYPELAKTTNILPCVSIHRLTQSEVEKFTKCKEKEKKMDEIALSELKIEETTPESVEDVPNSIDTLEFNFAEGVQNKKETPKCMSNTTKFPEKPVHPVIDFQSSFESYIEEVKHKGSLTLKAGKQKTENHDSSDKKPNTIELCVEEIENQSSSVIANNTKDDFTGSNDDNKKDVLVNNSASSKEEIISSVRKRRCSVNLGQKVDVDLIKTADTKYEEVDVKLNTIVDKDCKSPASFRKNNVLMKERPNKDKMEKPLLPVCAVILERNEFVERASKPIKSVVIPPGTGFHSSSKIEVVSKVDKREIVSLQLSKSDSRVEMNLKRENFLSNNPLCSLECTNSTSKFEISKKDANSRSTVQDCNLDRQCSKVEEKKSLTKFSLESEYMTHGKDIVMEKLNTSEEDTIEKSDMTLEDTTVLKGEVNKNDEEGSKMKIEDGVRKDDKSSDEYVDLVRDNKIFPDNIKSVCSKEVDITSQATALSEADDQNKEERMNSEVTKDVKNETYLSEINEDIICLENCQEKEEQKVTLGIDSRNEGKNCTDNVYGNNEDEAHEDNTEVIVCSKKDDGNSKDEMGAKVLENLDKTTLENSEVNRAKTNVGTNENKEYSENIEMSSEDRAMSNIVDVSNKGRFSQVLEFTSEEETIVKEDVQVNQQDMISSDACASKNENGTFSEDASMDIVNKTFLEDGESNNVERNIENEIFLEDGESNNVERNSSDDVADNKERTASLGDEACSEDVGMNKEESIIPEALAVDNVDVELSKEKRNLEVTATDVDDKVCSKDVELSKEKRTISGVVAAHVDDKACSESVGLNSEERAISEVTDGRTCSGDIELNKAKTISESVSSDIDDNSCSEDVEFSEEERSISGFDGKICSEDVRFNKERKTSEAVALDIDDEAISEDVVWSREERTPETIATGVNEKACSEYVEVKNEENETLEAVAADENEEDDELKKEENTISQVLVTDIEDRTCSENVDDRVRSEDVQVTEKERMKLDDDDGLNGGGRTLPENLKQSNEDRTYLECVEMNADLPCSKDAEAIETVTFPENTKMIAEGADIDEKNEMHLETKHKSINVTLSSKNDADKIDHKIALCGQNITNEIDHRASHSDCGRNDLVLPSSNTENKDVTDDTVRFCQDKSLEAIVEHSKESPNSSLPLQQIDDNAQETDFKIISLQQAEVNSPVSSPSSSKSSQINKETDMVCHDHNESNHFELGEEKSDIKMSESLVSNLTLTKLDVTIKPSLFDNDNADSASQFTTAFIKSCPDDCRIQQIAEKNFVEMSNVTFKKVTNCVDIDEDLMRSKGTDLCDGQNERQEIFKMDVVGDESKRNLEMNKTEETFDEEVMKPDIICNREIELNPQKISLDDIKNVGEEEIDEPSEKTTRLNDATNLVQSVTESNEGELETSIDSATKIRFSGASLNNQDEQSNFGIESGEDMKFSKHVEIIKEGEAVTGDVVNSVGLFTTNMEVFSEETDVNKGGETSEGIVNEDNSNNVASNDHKTFSDNIELTEEELSHLECVEMNEDDSENIDVQDEVGTYSQEIELNREDGTSSETVLENKTNGTFLENIQLNKKIDTYLIDDVKQDALETNKEIENIVMYEENTLSLDVITTTEKDRACTQLIEENEDIINVGNAEDDELDVKFSDDIHMHKDKSTFSQNIKVDVEQEKLEEIKESTEESPSLEHIEPNEDEGSLEKIYFKEAAVSEDDKICREKVEEGVAVNDDSETLKEERISMETGENAEKVDISIELIYNENITDVDNDIVDDVSRDKHAEDVIHNDDGDKPCEDLNTQESGNKNYESDVDILDVSYSDVVDRVVKSGENLESECCWPSEKSVKTVKGGLVGGGFDNETKPRDSKNLEISKNLEPPHHITKSDVEEFDKNVAFEIHDVKLEGKTISEEVEEIDNENVQCSGYEEYSNSYTGNIENKGISNSSNENVTNIEIDGISQTCKCDVEDVNTSCDENEHVKNIVTCIEGEEITTFQGEYENKDNVNAIVDEKKGVHVDGGICEGNKDPKNVEFEKENESISIAEDNKDIFKEIRIATEESDSMNDSKNKAVVTNKEGRYSKSNGDNLKVNFLDPGLQNNSNVAISSKNNRGSESRNSLKMLRTRRRVYYGYNSSEVTETNKKGNVSEENSKLNKKRHSKSRDLEIIPEMENNSYQKPEEDKAKGEKRNTKEEICDEDWKKLHGEGSTDSVKDSENDDRVVTYGKLDTYEKICAENEIKPDSFKEGCHSVKKTDAVSVVGIEQLGMQVCVFPDLGVVIEKNKLEDNLSEDVQCRKNKEHFGEVVPQGKRFSAEKNLNENKSDKVEESPANDENGESNKEVAKGDESENEEISDEGVEKDEDNENERFQDSIERIVDECIRSKDKNMDCYKKSKECESINEMNEYCGSKGEAISGNSGYNREVDSLEDNKPFCEIPKQQSTPPTDLKEKNEILAFETSPIKTMEKNVEDMVSDKEAKARDDIRNIVMKKRKSSFLGKSLRKKRLKSCEEEKVHESDMNQEAEKSVNVEVESEATELLMEKEERNKTVKEKSTRSNGYDEDDLSDYSLVIEEDSSYKGYPDPFVPHSEKRFKNHPSSSSSSLKEVVVGNVIESDKEMGKLDEKVEEGNNDKEKVPAGDKDVNEEQKNASKVITPAVESSGVKSLMEKVVSKKMSWLERKRKAFREKMESMPFTWDLEDNLGTTEKHEGEHTGSLLEHESRQHKFENLIHITPSSSVQEESISATHKLASVKKSKTPRQEPTQSKRTIKRTPRKRLNSPTSETLAKVKNILHSVSQTTSDSNISSPNTQIPLTSTPKRRGRPKKPSLDNDSNKKKNIPALLSTEESPHFINIDDDEITFNTRSLSPSFASENTPDVQNSSSKKRGRPRKRPFTDSESSPQQIQKVKDSMSNCVPSDSSPTIVKNPDVSDPKLKKAGLIPVAKTATTVSPAARSITFPSSTSSSLCEGNKTILSSPKFGKNDRSIPISPVLSQNKKFSKNSNISKSIPDFKSASSLATLKQFLPDTNIKPSPCPHNRISSSFLETSINKNKKDSDSSDKNETSTAAVVKRRNPTTVRKHFDFQNSFKRNHKKMTTAKTTVYRVDPLPQSTSKTSLNTSEQAEGRTLHTPLPPGVTHVKPKKTSSAKWKIDKEMKPTKVKAKQRRTPVSFKRT